ncbi:hypothetical protein MRB53_038261 [Persea americana]|nr:hypothetical protein MRB53_038261 [Persea americana]
MSRSSSSETIHTCMVLGQTQNRRSRLWISPSEESLTALPAMPGRRTRQRRRLHKRATSTVETPPKTWTAPKSTSTQDPQSETSSRRLNAMPVSSSPPPVLPEIQRVDDLLLAEILQCRGVA